MQLHKLTVGPIVGGAEPRMLLTINLDGVLEPSDTENRALHHGAGHKLSK